MSRHPGTTFQTEIFNTLKASTQIKAICGNPARVFDSLQRGTQYPYIKIGEASFGDGGSHTEWGTEGTITIHSWSQYAGTKEVRAIMDAVYEALHEADLTLTGHLVILMRQEFDEVLEDPDGKTRHGVQRFRVITREA